MWRIMGRSITREIRVVDLHLSEGGYVARLDSSDAFYSQPLIKRSDNS